MKLACLSELRKEIKIRESRIENLKAVTLSLSRIDGLPKTQNLESRVEKIASEIVDTEREIDNLRGELAEKSLDLSELILQRLSSTTARAMILRYVQGKPCKEISQTMGYTLRYTSLLIERGKKIIES